MAKYGIIVFGILLSWWGIYNFKQKDPIVKDKKIFNILDIIINGFGSGLGMILSGIICIIIGIVLFFV